ncbi:MAG: hypothetical protein EA406_08005 [Rhodospirillales bacterium]|nr:MAG: hypothetical protein EA406_08005 [Rhodospirillales bacterium]
MQVAPGGRGEDLELRGRRRDDDTGGSGRGDERSESAFGDRYHFRLAHEPGLDRPLLQVVDRQTEEPMMSIPPKQLARMFAEVRAMLNGPLGGEAAPRRVDTAA